jgi:hypothetical protein
MPGLLVTLVSGPLTTTPGDGNFSLVYRLGKTYGQGKS